MKIIGKYFDKEVFWFDSYGYPEELPEGNWLCLCVANQRPDLTKFIKFARYAIEKEILLFMGCGEYGELLHDSFDEVIAILETQENHNEIDMMTTWHNNESIKDVFWQGCYGLYLPERTDYDKIKIVCMDLDGMNRVDELKSYINDFEAGYNPE
ncbi:MAG: hypothetical protein PHN88_13930 [Ignavibacteria bacterium]|nr:hypothetical protein [Ignavibacteria bacterium]